VSKCNNIETDTKKLSNWVSQRKPSIPPAPRPQKITGASGTAQWGLWWKATSESWTESSVLYWIPYCFKYKQISEQRKWWDVKSL